MIWEYHKIKLIYLIMFYEGKEKCTIYKLHENNIYKLHEHVETGKTT